MANQYARTCSVQHDAGSRNVGLQASQWFLNNVHGVAIVLQDGRYGLPAGTVGERAMDQNDVLDGSVSQGRKSDAEYSNRER